MLGDEKQDLEEMGDDISDTERQRLDQLNALLSVLKTEDIIYPQPMLTDQMSYLYNMINTADQAPGREAEDRFEALAEALLDVSTSADE